MNFYGAKVWNSLPDDATSALSLGVNLPAPSEDILIPLLLQHWLILLVLTLAILVLVVALLLRPL